MSKKKKDDEAKKKKKRVQLSEEEQANAKGGLALNTQLIQPTLQINENLKASKTVTASTGTTSAIKTGANKMGWAYQ